MLGDPVIDPVTGLPQTRIEEGVPMIVRGPALVETGAGEGDAVGMARKSRLAEILFGETLKAGAEARTAHPNPPSTAPDHSTHAQRRREAPGRRVDGPRRQVLQRPVRRQRRAPGRQR